MTVDHGDAYVDYNRRFFRRWSPVYDLFARPIVSVYRAAAGAVDAHDGDLVLDLCTGTGELAGQIARAGAHVVAIDLSEEMLVRARRKLSGLPVRFEQGDARRVHYPARSFDVVAISLALHDMPRAARLAVLREALRLARRRVVIVDYELPGGVWGAIWARSIDWFETAYFRRFAAEGITPLLAELGVVANEHRRLRPLPFGLWRLEREPADHSAGASP